MAREEDSAFLDGGDTLEIRLGEVSELADETSYDGDDEHRHGLECGDRRPLFYKWEIKTELEYKGTHENPTQEAFPGLLRTEDGEHFMLAKRSPDKHGEAIGENRQLMVGKVSVKDDKGVESEENHYW